MASEGAPDDGPAPRPFSWLDQHPQFCILIVGEEEKGRAVFGPHKDLLADKSTWFREYFAKKDKETPTVELVIKLPDLNPLVFGLAQTYFYTGNILVDGKFVTHYDVLIDLWKMGYEFGIRGLCDEVMGTMEKNRNQNNNIPSVDLLVKVWKETPEGESLRKLLIDWTADYVRLSEARAEFTRGLPKEILSELVVAMSDLNASHPAQAEPSPQTPVVRKNVHRLNDEDNDVERPESEVRMKKRRKSRPSEPRPKKSKARQSLSSTRKPPTAKRASLVATEGLELGDDGEFAEEHKLVFCSDMILRMTTGPGFWTRVVGPFKNPVRPIEDGVPDYLEKIERPMDLSTIKRKVDDGEYRTADEFHRDVKQIWENCYTYWGRDHEMSKAAEKFQKHYEEKYGEMFKWLITAMKTSKAGEGAQTENTEKA